MSKPRKHGPNPQTQKRLQNELEELKTKPPPLCRADLRGNNLLEWEAFIQGPPGTPYEGGEFKLHLNFPRDYPFKPPSVQFKTRIYHCNVDCSGRICLDILANKWTPTFRVSALLVAICSLMAECNPHSSLDGEIARLFLKQRPTHDKNAKEYTKKYAMQ